MTRTPLRWLLSGLAAVVIAGAVGCSPPEPGDPALMNYFTNVRHEGHVQRLWPAGQAYADRVLKYYVVFRDRMKSLTHMTYEYTVWLEDDPRWQNQEALKAHIKDLEARLAQFDGRKPDAGPAPTSAAVVEPTTKPAEMKPKDIKTLTMDQLLDAMDEVIHQPPDGLRIAEGGATVDFGNRVWRELTDGEKAARETATFYEQVVKKRLDFYKRWLDQASEFATDKPGFNLRDEQLDSEFRDELSALRAYFAEHDNGLFDKCERRMRILGVDLRNIDIREDRSDYQCYTAEREYWKNKLKEQAKAYRAVRDEAVQWQKAADEALKKATGEKQEQLTKICAAWDTVVKELDERRRAAQERVDDLLKRVDEKPAGEAQPSAGD